jgi:hypothetical protein
MVITAESRSGAFRDGHEYSHAISLVFGLWLSTESIPSQWWPGHSSYPMERGSDRRGARLVWRWDSLPASLFADTDRLEAYPTARSRGPFARHHVGNRHWEIRFPRLEVNCVQHWESTSRINLHKRSCQPRISTQSWHLTNRFVHEVVCRLPLHHSSPLRWLVCDHGSGVAGGRCVWGYCCSA